MASAAILATNMADGAALSSSGSLAGSPVSRLKAPHVTDGLWLSSTAGAGWVKADLGVDRAVDTVALPGLNLTGTGTVRVRVSSEAGGSEAGDLHDATYGAADPEFDPDYRMAVVLLPAPVMARHVMIDLTDGAVAAPGAGRLVIGLREALVYNFAPGGNLGWNDLSEIERARGGQTLAWLRPHYRSTTISLPWVDNAQRWGLIERLGRVNGQSNDILLVLDPAHDSLPQVTVWGRVTNAITPSWTGLPDIHAVQLTVEERL
ncbi:MAG: hypothetical protein KIS96_03425 [Bauldia sp.]|nr:hypothetical protein [Bauldia sp.]